MYIVMTSSAKSANGYGVYRNVAVVEIDQEYTAKQWRPKMISDRAKGVLSVRYLGRFSVGKTPRSAYQRAVARAEAACYAANSAGDIATAESYVNPCCA
jgi:hypothetical protein